MQIQTSDAETAQEVKIVSFEGNLDTNTSESAEQHLQQLINEGSKKILIDLEKLNYISSAGLRILLATTKKIRGVGGEMRISSLNETVKEVFEISGFSMIFNVFDTKEKALSGF